MAAAPDDDLRRILREFKESTAAALSSHDDRFQGLEARMDALEGRMGGLEGRMGGLEGSVRELADEFRVRTLTMETAILNSIRDFSRSVDSRLTRVEQRLDGAA